MDDPIENGEYLFLCFLPFFKFQVFVPEGMCKKVQSNTARTSFEEPKMRWLVNGADGEGGRGSEGRGGGQQTWRDSAR